MMFWLEEAWNTIIKLVQSRPFDEMLGWPSAALPFLTAIPYFQVMTMRPRARLGWELRGIPLNFCFEGVATLHWREKLLSKRNRRYTLLISYPYLFSTWPKNFILLACFMSFLSPLPPSWIQNLLFRAPPPPLSEITFRRISKVMGLINNLTSLSPLWDYKDSLSLYIGCETWEKFRALHLCIGCGICKNSQSSLEV